MSDNVKPENLIYTLNDIMEDRFGRYAKYIIQDRALPDVRDGLKPVQRRILFAMNELNLTFNSSYKKSARIVGEVIGKYHPHGDTSVYDAMVRLSQDWKVRYPLIDMHGNNGSIDGDPAAAMRYTETRLSEVASYLLQDLEKDTVAFIPNFDDSEQEPVVLPALFPNLLINGATGIAAGYATNIPPHNLPEIIDATIFYLSKPTCRLSELLKFIKGPDFPTGGIVQGKQGIIDAYQTGKGKIIIRSKITNENNNLVITEIPYEVVKQDLVKKIDDIKYNEPGLNIKEVRDETDRTGLRIVIELSKQANYETVRKYLLKNTNLQVSYNFNIVGIANKQPKLLGLKEILGYYVAHQQEIVTNRSKFELAKATKRSEIVDGLIKTVSILDEVIAVIRHSKDRQDAIKNLVVKFSFTQLQAEAIVQLRLYRLTSTDILQLQAEQKELKNLITELEAILSDINKLNSVIVEQLTLIKNKFNAPRRTFIEEEIETIEIEKTETIIEKDLNIWVSYDGYIKALENNQLARLANEDFKRKPNDLWIADLQANTLDKLLLITSKGNYVIIPVYKIKVSKIKDIGEHVNTISELPGEEKIIGCYLLNDFNKPDNYIMLATKNGMIKKTAVPDFMATRISKAIRAINLKGDDEVVNSQLVTKQPYIIIATANGFAVKYKASEIPTLGLRTAGVKAINLKDDIVVNAGYCKDDSILLLTDHGTAKRIATTELALSARPIKGARLFKQNKKSPELVKLLFIAKNKDVLNVLNANDEINVFKVDKLPVTGLALPAGEFELKNIVNAVIPTFYDLKQIPSVASPTVNPSEPKHPSQAGVKKAVAANQKQSKASVTPAKSSVSTPSKVASEKGAIKDQTSISKNDDEVDLNPQNKIMINFNEPVKEDDTTISNSLSSTQIVEEVKQEGKNEDSVPSVPDVANKVKPQTVTTTVEKLLAKKEEQKQQVKSAESISPVSEVVKAPEIKEPVKAVSPTEFKLKSFGKVTTTVEKLLAKKEEQKQQIKSAESISPVSEVVKEPEIKEPTKTVSPTEFKLKSFGKVTTTVEKLVTKKTITSEIPEPEKLIKVDFTNKKPTNKKVDKTQFKNDLAIDETKELQITFDDLLKEKK
ncbi:DNA topoisomerase IV subunit A [Spiroplasma syrphidicola EA-1]|uniref:DNA topoisomerase 4 subunit A n=1 Tax=Spiroplasma syrphidicola EA-1 TaxID=1276229 RepID=R4U401_9MOLU|nr:DNA topoisomerase IV subunit A [Spiroplasma syrphidicola]AGM26147.1 DNA topoisomerase IV subunit A [Spiroplasma syrphidicola EA-1]